MGLLDFVPSIFRKKLYQALYTYEIHSGQANLMPDNAISYIQNGYAGNASVYSIINRIDAMRKQAYLKLYKKNKQGEYQEIKSDHELLRFTEKVNQTTYTDDFITAHLVYLLTIGEFFAYRPMLQTGINKGKVYELFELPAPEVEIIEGSIFAPVKGYKIEGNYNIEFEAFEVYHSKLFNPLAKEERSLHGLSPLRAASRIVSKLNEIELTSLKQLENQGAPYILYKDVANSANGIDANVNRLTDIQRAEIIKEIKKSASEKTRGLPLVLKDKMGKLDLGSKLADLEIIESSRDGIRTLCNVYGFPVDLMNDPTGSTYNNKSTARKSAWTDCIIPNLERVQQTFNACLINGVDPFKDYKFMFDYSDVEELQEGIETKVAWMRQARWTGNEIREATGKSTIDNPLMDEPIMPMGDGFLSDYSGDELEPDFEDYEENEKPKK
jgi:HK97 family phage portal protein